MGRIGPVHRGGSAPSSRPRHAHTPARLCGDGALAHMDGSGSHGMRYAHVQQAQQGNSHRHLTALLSPLDAKPDLLAARLLYRFGSIGRIAQASETDLRKTAGRGETWVDALLVVRQLMHDGMREELIRTRLGEDRDALYSYLLMTMQKLSEERMLVIFADSAGFVIAEEVVAEGEEAHLMLSPRRIFRRAMNLDARRLVLVHNHPSGCAEPSRTDIEQTTLLCRQAAGLGLCIDDHLIVGCREVVSMKDRGLM